MEFKFNGKSLLLLGVLSASIAFGEHISVLNNDGSQISSNPMEKVMTVGSIVVRVDDINPSTIYGGTWELIQGDAALRLGNGTNQTTIVEGNDVVTMPIPKHSHDMSHTHTRGTMDFDGYFPTIITGAFQDGTGGAFWAIENSKFQNKSAYTNSTVTNHGMHFTASRNWTGNTSQPDNLNTSEEGVDNATVNVKGAHINLNIWKRTL
jgi:hypothetical protein